MKPTIYLSGPIDNITKEQATGWRDQVTTELKDLYDLSDPTIKDLGPAVGCERRIQIVHLDKVMIGFSQALFVHVPLCSPGTMMEIIHAWERGKYIVTVCNEPKLAKSHWLIYHSHRLYSTIEQGIAHFRSAPFQALVYQP